MRKPLWLVVAMLLFGVGCPFEFGIDGRIDKAVKRDMKENVEDVKVKKDDCPAGKHRERPKLPCTNPPCKPACVADP